MTGAVSVLKCTHLENDQIRLGVVAVHHAWIVYCRDVSDFFQAIPGNTIPCVSPLYNHHNSFFHERGHTTQLQPTTWNLSRAFSDTRHCSCLVSCTVVVHYSSAHPWAEHFLSTTSSGFCQCRQNGCSVITHLFTKIVEGKLLHSSWFSIVNLVIL